jgi:hypothetical protein
MARSLTRKNQELREKVKKLEADLEKIKSDREKFRDYFTGKLKWFVELHGENKAPSMAWLIQDMGRLMNRVENWYW